MNDALKKKFVSSINCIIDSYDESNCEGFITLRVLLEALTNSDKNISTYLLSMMDHHMVQIALNFIEMQSNLNKSY